MTNPFGTEAQQGAKTVWDYYDAFVQQGFSEAQAMELTKTILVGVLGAQR